jgi:hypothetical protein
MLIGDDQRHRIVPDIGRSDNARLEVNKIEIFTARMLKRPLE